jgi:hypothetical protein
VFNVIAMARDEGDVGALLRQAAHERQPETRRAARNNDPYVAHISPPAFDTRQATS